MSGQPQPDSATLGTIFARLQNFSDSMAATTASLTSIGTRLNELEINNLPSGRSRPFSLTSRKPFVNELTGRPYRSEVIARYSGHAIDKSDTVLASPRF